MKRATIRSRSFIAAALAALISPLIASSGASNTTRVQRSAADGPSGITLPRTAEVKVTAAATGVLVQWRTPFELDHLGFNVYREQDGVRTQVNPSIIAGSAMVAGEGTSSYFPYQWFDAEGNLNSRYYLEDIDLKGGRTLVGPLAPLWSESLPKSQQAKTISEVSAAQASATTQIGGPTGTLDRPAVSPAAIQDQWAIAAQPGLKIGVKQDGWYRVTQPDMVAAGFDVSPDSQNLRLFADGREVPVEVNKSSGPLSANDYLEFYGTGLDTPTTDTHVYYLINGSQAGLRIPVAGEIQTNVVPLSSPMPSPLAQSTNDARGLSNGVWFGDVSAGVIAEKAERANEPIVSDRAPAVMVPPFEENNAAGLPQSTSDQKTALNLGQDVRPEPSTIREESKPVVAAPQAMARNSSQLQFKIKSRHRRLRNRRRQSSHNRRRHHALAAATSTAGFLYDVQLKERFVYFSSLLNGPAENYFGGLLLTPPVTKTLTVTNLQTDSLGTAFLKIGLQGTSLQPHLVNVLLNDVMVGSISFDSQQYAEQTFSLAVSLLHEGDNIIKFVIAGGSGDHSLYSYARLTYPHTFRADADTFSFSQRSAQSTKIDGFTTPNLRVLDVSDPTVVQEVRPVVETAGAGFAATVPATAAKAKGSRTLLALPASSFLHPASLVFNQPSTLNQGGNPANAADLLIISHQNFIPSLAPLISKRQGEGFTVKVVDIEDVFDEFSYGMHTPQAITDFLAQARASWTQAPRYLLLVGDASYDPRNYEGVGNFDLVPTKLIDTAFLETASDDTLTDFDGDGIPEIPVGRLPVRTLAEANLIIGKIVNFSPGNVPQNALMVADTQGSYFFNFEDANDQISALLPPGMTVQKVYRRLELSDATTRADIISKINSGTALVNYSGHGNVDVWTGAPIFSASDAMALTNGNKLPLVIVMDCLNGYFASPPIDCLSEALMKAPNGGAVASFSSSGLTIPIGQHQMGQTLFQLLYSGAPIALGDATRQAKSATTDIDVRRTWILFGDPTMKIR
jgi:hypothetical protein